MSAHPSASRRFPLSRLGLIGLIVAALLGAVLVAAGGAEAAPGGTKGRKAPVTSEPTPPLRPRRRSRRPSPLPTPPPSPRPTPPPASLSSSRAPLATPATSLP